MVLNKASRYASEAMVVIFVYILKKTVLRIFCFLFVLFYFIFPYFCEVV